VRAPVTQLFSQRVHCFSMYCISMVAGVGHGKESCRTFEHINLNGRLNGCLNKTNEKLYCTLHKVQENYKRRHAYSKQNKGKGTTSNHHRCSSKHQTPYFTCRQTTLPNSLYKDYTLKANRIPYLPDNKTLYRNCSEVTGLRVSAVASAP
jgi:hypothetical protein